MNTLVCRLTPAGSSALATIAVAGEHAQSIVEQLFRPATRTIPIARLFERRPGPHYGHFGRSITDDVVVARTTEDRQPPTFEIHCHGGPAMAESLMTEIEACGAVRTQWQEFRRFQGWTEIAIESAEGASQARTTRTAGLLLAQQTVLEERMERILQDRDRPSARELLQWYSFGRHLIDPWRVVILGRPNVGKSTLLNAMLGYQRAIISPTPGTTRDRVEGETAIDGWPVLFTDGAGIRDATDEVENLGIEEMKRTVREADARILVCDLTEPDQTGDMDLLDRYAPELVVGNKSDLPCRWNHAEVQKLPITVSAQTGDGITELLHLIRAALVPALPAPDQPVPFTDRQRQLLEDVLRNKPS